MAGKGDHASPSADHFPAINFPAYLPAQEAWSIPTPGRQRWAGLVAGAISLSRPAGSLGGRSRHGATPPVLAGLVRLGMLDVVLPLAGPRSDGMVARAVRPGTRSAGNYEGLDCAVNGGSGRERVT